MVTEIVLAAPTEVIINFLLSKLAAVKLLVPGTVVLAPLIKIMSPAFIPALEVILNVTVADPLVVVIVDPAKVDLIGCMS